jgi:predicted metal-dependent peptidase
VPSPGPSLANRAKLLKARTVLAERDAFLGHLVLNLPVQITADPSVQTAQITAQGRCLIRDAFLEELQVPELATILLHETLHLALDCHHRRESREPTLWNFAHDLAVNGLIEDSMGEAGSLAWPKAFPPLKECALHGLAAEPIYDLLLETLQLEGEQRGLAKSLLAGMGGKGAVEHSGRWSPEQREAALRVLQNQALWVLDLDSADWDRLDAATRNELRQRWQGVLLEAAEQTLRGHGIGSLPGWAKRLLGPLLTPRMPWWALLARRVHGHLQGERRSFSRPGRRGRAAGVTLPGKLRHRGVVGVFVDVSGSISPEDLGRFISELKGILEQTGHSVRLMAWDTEVTLDLLLEDAASLQQSLLSARDPLTGGGGTDPRCVIRRLESGGEEPMPHFGVLLTDGYVPWPEADDWPLELLVVCTGPLPPRDLGYDALELETETTAMEIE